MKTTFEITKEQINELYNDISISNNSYRLKQWFPQAFESELEVGKWYKRRGELLVWNGGKNTYGFVESGIFYDDMAFTETKSVIPATDKEVEKALIAEAKRRGFKEGVRYIAVGEEKGRVSYYYSGRLRYRVGGKDALCQAGYPRIYFEGKWAEIISESIEVTLEQIAEKFNVNVEQLKIKK